jgi:hypothetical protein
MLREETRVFPSLPELATHAKPANPASTRHVSDLILVHGKPM